MVYIDSLQLGVGEDVIQEDIHIIQKIYNLCILIISRKLSGSNRNQTGVG